jgi:hypothetical protein
LRGLDSLDEAIELYFAEQFALLWLVTVCPYYMALLFVIEALPFHHYLLSDFLRICCDALT